MLEDGTKGKKVDRRHGWVEKTMIRGEQKHPKYTTSPEKKNSTRLTVEQGKSSCQLQYFFSSPRHPPIDKARTRTYGLPMRRPIYICVGGKERKKRRERLRVIGERQVQAFIRLFSISSTRCSIWVSRLSFEPRKKSTT